MLKTEQNLCSYQTKYDQMWGMYLHLQKQTANATRLGVIGNLSFKMGQKCGNKAAHK